MLTKHPFEDGCDYIVWHDIDMIPEQGCDYSFPKENPIHIKATNISQMDYKLKYEEYFGEGSFILKRTSRGNKMVTQMIIGIGEWKMMIYFGDVI